MSLGAPSPVRGQWTYPEPLELLSASAVWESSLLGWQPVSVACYFIRELVGTLEMALTFACSDCLTRGGTSFTAFPPSSVVASKHDRERNRSFQKMIVMLCSSACHYEFFHSKSLDFITLELFFHHFQHSINICQGQRKGMWIFILLI